MRTDLKDKDVREATENRLDAIRHEVFDLANSLAGEETGTIAGELHQACNYMSNALRMMKEGITAFDTAKQISE